MSTNKIPTKDTSTQPTIPPPSPSSSSSAPQTANPHLIYIALSLNTNLTDDPDPIHWSLLVTPATTSSPTHLLYTYSAHTTTTTPIKTRIWKSTRQQHQPPSSHPDHTALSPSPNTTHGLHNLTLTASLLIAEISSLDALNTHITACSPNDVPVLNAPGYMSVAWMWKVLERLDKDEDGEESGGGKGKGAQVFGETDGVF